MPVLMVIETVEMNSGQYFSRTQTPAYLSPGSSDSTEIDPGHQGRTSYPIFPLLDLHFNSQQAR